MTIVEPLKQLIKALFPDPNNPLDQEILESLATPFVPMDPVTQRGLAILEGRLNPPAPIYEQLLASPKPALFDAPRPNRSPPLFDPNMRDPPKLISDSLLAPPKENNMEIAAILALINGLLPLIQSCREDQTDDQLVSAARGFQGVMAIRKANRANGLRGRRFRIANREAVDTMAAMSDQELKEQVINAPEFEKDEDGNDGIDYNLFS